MVTRKEKDGAREGAYDARGARTTQVRRTRNMVGGALMAFVFVSAVKKTAAASYHQDSILADASESLASIGATGLCHPTSHDFEPFFPHCEEHGLHHYSDDVGLSFDGVDLPGSSQWRYLAEGGAEKEEDDWFYLRNSLLATMCVVMAALAAGLTMGLMSIDPLMLLIKMRAGATTEEREQAAALLPVVKQHHLLLVTLLLLNSIANEALPLFLDALVPGYVAVIMSVTLVLFFGEIIPSAVFTGPNQMKLAFRLLPLVRVVMALLFPIAYPISKTLDHFLHDEDGTSSAFNRKELSALVRIQYEEHLAAKRRQRAERAEAARGLNRLNGDNSQILAQTVLDASVREIKRELENSADEHSYMSNTTDASVRSTYQRSPSIHMDEVSMVEGALSMKTKFAIDVFTPLHRMIAVPYDTILNETNIVKIYSSGYSRIPVYDRNPERKRDKTAIRGILMTRQLIVINASDRRELRTLPLHTPACVSPKKNLVDLINMFQTGKGGHMALVCARPKVGTEALDRGDAIPASAGLMGIITLEDALEALLSEQILDEFDRNETNQVRLARWVVAKWKLQVNKNKAEREEEALSQQQDPRILDVVNRATAAMNAVGLADSTPLLGVQDSNSNEQKEKGFFGLFR